MNRFVSKNVNCLLTLLKFWEKRQYSSAEITHIIQRHVMASKEKKIFLFWKITTKVVLFVLHLILLEHKKSDLLRIFYPNKGLQLSLWKRGDIQSRYIENPHLSVYIWMSIIHVIPVRGDLAWGRKILSLSEDNFFYSKWRIIYPCLRFFYLWYFSYNSWV